MSETTTAAPEARPATRVVEGRPVPAAGTWQVDKAHSSVEFVARHLMVTKVRGRFADYDIDLSIGEAPEDSRVEVSIRGASITTGDEGRDAHLTSLDFLDVANYPELSYRSTAVVPVAETIWRTEGNLTIRGVTKPVALEVEFAGVTTDPWGNEKAFFTARGEFDRGDFGLTWNQPLASGGVLVGKRVKVEIELQASR